jgi:hypothetical protein
MWATRVPFAFHFHAPQLDWFYINTSMMTFTIIAVVGFTFLAIFLGNRIVEGKLTPFSFFSYFAFFGFIAPMWLARAVWNASLSRKTTWR